MLDVLHRCVPGLHHPGGDERELAQHIAPADAELAEGFEGEGGGGSVATHGSLEQGKQRVGLQQGDAGIVEGCEAGQDVAA